MTTSFFGLCGIFAVPALLSTGQAPAMSVALGKIIHLDWHVHNQANFFFYFY